MFSKFSEFFFPKKFTFSALLNKEKNTRNTIICNDDFTDGCIKGIFSILDEKLSNSYNIIENDKILYTAFNTLAECGMLELAQDLLPHISKEGSNAIDRFGAYRNLACIYAVKGNYEASAAIAKMLGGISEGRILEFVEKQKNLPEFHKRVKEMEARDKLQRSVSRLNDEDRSLIDSKAGIEEVKAYFEAQQYLGKSAAERDEYNFRKRQRVMEFIGLYLREHKFMEADILAQLIADKYEKWKTMRMIANAWGEYDTLAALRYVKQIKENETKVMTTGEIGLSAYDKHEGDLAFDIIGNMSKNYIRQKDIIVGRLIEKLAIQSDLEKAWELLDKGWYTSNKYYPFVKIAIRDMLNGKTIDPEPYLRRLDHPVDQIKFYGFLAFFRNRLKNNLLDAWMYFAPESWQKNVHYGTEVEDKIVELYVKA